MLFQVPRPGGDSPIGPVASEWRTGMGLRHLSLAFTGFSSVVPPAAEFGRFRHSRVSGNTHKRLTSKEETHHG